MKKIVFLLTILLFIAMPIANCYSAVASSNTVTLLPSYSNPAYDYTITPVADIYNILNISPDNDVLVIGDKENLFSAAISCERFSDQTLSAMRDYLNDSTSSANDMFEKFASYKQSYLEAMKDYYRKSLLYGADSEDSEESNMKVFAEYNEKIYNQSSRSVLYNIVKATQTGSSEEIHIDISIPVSKNSTFYSISFMLKRGNLNDAAIEKMSALINSIHISGLPAQSESISLFSDKQAVSLSNSGIYPDLDKTKFIYTELSNNELGYKISYPSVYTPYMENNIMQSFDYHSFKIDFNSSFSISAEPASAADAVRQKIKLIKDFNKESIKNFDESALRLKNKEVTRISYEIIRSGSSTYVSDYLIAHNSILYSIELKSRYKKASQKTCSEILKTVASLEFTAPLSSIKSGNASFVKFTNSEEGYSFSYPDSWQVMPNNTFDINYDSYSVKNPDFSGPIDIITAEGEFNTDPNAVEALRGVTGANSAVLKNYSAPYKDKNFRILSAGFESKDGYTYIYKLVNYLDSNGRVKLCYSTDIIRGRKIYSFFVNISEYAASNEKVFNSETRSIVNLIANSFKLENTPEYLERKLEGEKRNRKLVFIENYLRKTLGENAHIVKASYLYSLNDVFADIENGTNSGYYRISMDFDRKEIKTVSKISRFEVMQAVQKDLRNQFKNKLLVNIVPNPSSMTVDVIYLDSKTFQPVKKTYEIRVRVIDGDFCWDIYE